MVSIIKIAEKKRAKKLDTLFSKKEQENNAPLGASTWRPRDFEKLYKRFQLSLPGTMREGAKQLADALSLSGIEAIKNNVFSTVLHPITATAAQLKRLSEMGGVIPTALGALAGTGLFGYLGYALGRGVGRAHPALRGIHWWLSSLGASTGGLATAALAASLATKEKRYLAIRDALSKPLERNISKALAETQREINKR